MDQVIFMSKLHPLSVPLYQMAFSILKEEDAAKDHLQELYIKLWVKRNELENIQNLKNFALKSMRNLCLDTLRSETHFDTLMTDLPSAGPGTLEKIEQKSLMKLIGQMIGRLPEMQRSIMRLRDIEGLDITEIAFIMSITENAVTANLSRARKKIREQLTALDTNLNRV